MARPAFLTLIAAAFAVVSHATPVCKRDITPVNTVSLNGEKYVNKGIVGFGLIPSNFRESTGDTLGGIGSAMALKPGSWVQNGTMYSGTLVMHPDRGYNIDKTINYQARQHEIDFVLTPYYNSTALSFTAAQQTLKLKYQKTTLLTERGGAKTTGLDASAVRNAQPGFPLTALADPPLPVASSSDPRLSLDVEGLVLNTDGSFWISDEYGPYIYLLSADKKLIQTIQPPRAVQPLDGSGLLSFTSASAPKTGRNANQGFENLTLDPQTKTLYAMLQSAVIQDGGDAKETAQFTRLFAYNVSNLSVPPPLIGEWVVPLPSSDKGKVLACSEILFVKPGVFLALSRDGDGRGGDDNNSKYKNADLFTIAGATDIHGSKYDDPANPIAKDGKLNSGITPAKYVPFISYVNSGQLKRFGLHNDSPNDLTLLDAKWESFALAPAGDSSYPDDYFLFTAADNDFISTDGVSIGTPFNAGLDVDNQFLVWRVTLPGLQKTSLCANLGIRC